VRIDVALHAVVEGPPVTMPPQAPELGQTWVTAQGAEGAWMGRDGQLASWTEGGWRFVDPVPGMLVWNKAAGHWLHRHASGWSGGELPAAGLIVAGKKVVGERQPGVPSPSGGTIIDEEARLAIGALTAALKSHGLIE
jgi:hypothetical protein